MSLRPVPARWFEAVVPRELSHRALEALAAIGSVELETRHYPRRTLELDVVDERLERFRQLAQQYQTYWPHPVYVDQLRDTPMDKVLAHAMKHLEDWHREAEALINRLQVLEESRIELEFWEHIWDRFQDLGIKIDLVRQTESAVSAIYCRVPSEEALALFGSVLSIPEKLEQGFAVLAIVPTEIREDLEQQILARKGQCIMIPDYLKKEGASLDELRQKLSEVWVRIDELKASLQTLNERHRLPWVLGELRCMDWFVSHAQRLHVSENFAWIRGWTSADEPESLARALSQAGIPGLVDFPEPPPGIAQPLLLKHREWIRPFEIFSYALGMPGKNEADPSVLLACIVPLLFGYMFGDVGQGLVLTVAGFALKKRWPMTRILILCGLSATAFGFAFGSVFAMEHLLPNYLPHPINAPIQTLLIPLIAGGVLLSGGILLSAVQTYWGAQHKIAVLGDLGFLLIYLASVISILDMRTLYLIPLGLLFYLLGQMQVKYFLASASAALGRLLESLFQILVNTLSFLRVGAFALAHAGLAVAVMTLIETTPGVIAKMLIFLLGNAVIIIVEGLVVSVQTTRLVLFEFFVRFVRGTGRPFRPLPLPPSAELRRSS